MSAVHADPATVTTPDRPTRGAGLRGLSRPAIVAVTIVNLGAFFGLWQLITVLGWVNRLFLPPVTDVFAAMYHGFGDGTIQPHLVHSLLNFVLGMAIAAAIGIPVGLLMGANRLLDLILSPYVWSFAALPRVALVPLLILILGFSNATQLTLIVISAVFPIIINCMAGVKTVEPSLVRAGQVFGASRPQIYAKVIVPSTLPFVIAGVNQGMTRGLVGMLIGELFAGNNGLGFLLNQASTNFNSPLLYAILLILAVFSLAFVQSARWLERRVASWRETS